MIQLTTASFSLKEAFRLNPRAFVLQIVSDNPDLLAVFLDPAHRGWIPIYPLQRLFSEACRLGSLRCVTLMVHTFRVVEALGSSSNISLLPDGVVDDAEPVLQVNELDEEGYSPFMYAVARNVELTRLLIHHGANVRRHSLHGDTALHLLFKNLASPPVGVAERARLLLGSGLEPKVNQQDREQCSALHHLVHHINNNVRYLSLTDTTNPETVVAPSAPEQQDAYQVTARIVFVRCMTESCNWNFLFSRRPKSLNPWSCF